LEKKNNIFGGKNSALTSNHGPKEAERRSRPAGSLFGSFSITAANYLINLKQEQLL